MAQLLVLTLSVTTLGPVLHDVHDEELQPLVVSHDETDHTVRSASAPDTRPFEADHCIACHFVRTSHSLGVWQASSLLADPADARLTPFEWCARASLTASPTPSRAPPALA
jgi:type IV secretory pathway TrbF-like protein